MSDSSQYKDPTRSQFRVVDLLFVSLSVALAMGCWLATSWDVGIAVGIMLLLFYRLRSCRHAVVPGAVLGTILAWLSIGVGDDPSDVLSKTALFATVGCALNSILLKYWVEGLIALGLELIAAVLIPLLGHS